MTEQKKKKFYLSKIRYKKLDKLEKFLYFSNN